MKKEEEKIQKAKNKKDRYRQVDKLQTIMRYRFNNKSILNHALTHRSYVNETGSHVQDNERLEYLGDSVLALVVNEYLYRHFDEYPEGKLAKIKSAAVSERTLASIAYKMKLGGFVQMGKGEESCGGRERSSILANTLEAIIGAIYLDSGLKESRKFILSRIKDDIDLIDNLSYMRDPKTTLQEIVQKKYKERPEYVITEEKGPDHKKEFYIDLIVNKKKIAQGHGSSKRKAEMNAARTALKELDLKNENIQ